MVYKVNFKEVETIGFENSPVAEALAGLRANEARYFWNKYKFEYVTYPANEKPELVELMTKILKEERDLVFSAKLLEVAVYEDEQVFWPEFYYEDGMVLNLLYEKVPAVEGKKPKRAVGIKLSVGMEVPSELEGKFKFARQRSKLAGEVRGSFFTVKQEWL
ncbi:phage tail protein [Lactococcus protaetiae]|uniref:Phage tail protein n=1 Tax=Lactococcus protaetiae TaxID=2592653 RepID=A0A514Z8C3_9LACT|nr:phage tail protein [Lactococcus protaetiae]MCL2114479.1 phage tail protein [Streptococcaceae bacterium]QDK70841.1 phage tail protein [Lactococcus protaetiae]